MCRILRFSLFVANCEFLFLASWQDQGAFFFVFIWFIESWTFLTLALWSATLPVYNSFFTTHETKTDLLQMKIKDNKSIVPLPLYYQVASHRLPVLTRTMFLHCCRVLYLKCFGIFPPLRNLSQLELMLHFDKIKIPFHMPLLRISHVYAGELDFSVGGLWYSLPPIQ